MRTKHYCITLKQRLGPGPNGTSPKNAKVAEHRRASPYAPELPEVFCALLLEDREHLAACEASLRGIRRGFPCAISRGSRTSG